MRARARVQEEGEEEGLDEMEQMVNDHVFGEGHDVREVTDVRVVEEDGSRRVVALAGACDSRARARVRHPPPAESHSHRAPPTGGESPPSEPAVVDCSEGRVHAPCGWPSPPPAGHHPHRRTSSDTIPIARARAPGSPQRACLAPAHARGALCVCCMCASGTRCV